MLVKLVTVAAAIVALSAAPATAAADSPPARQGNGIIAVLIGVQSPAAGSLTAPLGSTKGSFIDASAIYGSDD